MGKKDDVNKALGVRVAELEAELVETRATLQRKLAAKNDEIQLLGYQTDALQGDARAAHERCEAGGSLTTTLNLLLILLLLLLPLLLRASV